MCLYLKTKGYVLDAKSSQNTNVALVLTVKLIMGKSLRGFDSPPSLEKWNEFATATDVIARRTGSNIIIIS